MLRKQILSVAAALSCVLAAVDGRAEDAEQPVTLKPGPHLLVDDYLIARSVGVKRRVMPPARTLKEPIVTGAAEHQNWQPFLTVIHDPQLPRKQRFRMWYNVDVVDSPQDGEYFGATGLLESADGIHWPGPYRRLESLTPDGRVRFGASVIDEGSQFDKPAERYKMMYFDAGKQAGPRVAFSADGEQWQVHPKPVHQTNNGDDIWTAGYDPLRKRYYLVGKQFGPFAWTNAEGEPINLPIRRYLTSFSRDFRGWSDPQGMVFSPDNKDTGVTQWYGAAGMLVRGELIIGFLRVLRDDMTPEGAPQDAVKANNTGFAGLGDNKFGDRGGSGMGYTVLCWTRDGQTWQRDRHTDKFFEPDPKPGAWDHAMAWVGSATPVEDEVFLYYAGYRWGHKYRHSVDRQIGLVRMPRDRYVARTAGDTGGTLTTRPVTLGGDTLRLNADATDGEIRVQVTDVAGKPLDGFRFADCQPVTGDSLAAEVKFKRPLRELRGRPVRLEISLQHARLFALEL